MAKTYYDYLEEYKLSDYNEMIQRFIDKAKAPEIDVLIVDEAQDSNASQRIVLFITNRHPKDICRSFAHELIHHVQNLRGDLDKGDMSSPKYAQEDDHMRKMEMEAYLKGNMLFRDWEDWYKNYRKTNRK